MAVCTRHCKSLLNAVVSETSPAVCMGRVSLCGRSPNVTNHAGAVVLSSRGVCHHGASYSTSQNGGNRIQKGHCWSVQHQLQHAKTLGSFHFARHYSSEESDSETDFSHGYGGKLLCRFSFNHMNHFSLYSINGKRKLLQLNLQYEYMGDSIY